MMFSPQSAAILLQNTNPRLKYILCCISRCSYGANFEPWAGSVIWWAVQGILQMRLYALYHGSKKVLIFMTVAFVAEIGATMWILISENLVDSGTAFAVDISFGGYGKIDICFSPLSAAFPYFYIPCFVFEAVLCLFAIYAGVKNSRGRGHPSARFDRFRLIDVLIQGNVINFFSPLLMFILFMIPSTTGPAVYFAETLLFRAPIAILAGCRLILSVRKASSSFQSYEPAFNLVRSTIVSGDEINSSHAYMGYSQVEV
ncbi:hypothetical protein V8B97DRAFT_1922843 [Scleroderma yunnanense]